MEDVEQVTDQAGIVGIANLPCSIGSNKGLGLLDKTVCSLYGFQERQGTVQFPLPSHHLENISNIPLRLLQHGEEGIELLKDLAVRRRSMVGIARRGSCHEMLERGSYAK